MQHMAAAKMEIRKYFIIGYVKKQWDPLAGFKNNKRRARVSKIADFQ